MYIPPVSLLIYKQYLDYLWPHQSPSVISCALEELLAILPWAGRAVVLAGARVTALPAGLWGSSWRNHEWQETRFAHKLGDTNSSRTGELRRAALNAFLLDSLVHVAAFIAVDLCSARNACSCASDGWLPASRERGVHRRGVQGQQRHLEHAADHPERAPVRQWRRARARAAHLPGVLRPTLLCALPSLQWNYQDCSFLLLMQAAACTP